MALADLPLLIALVGLAAYAVLGGADFGAGFWALFSGRGERGAGLRAHAEHAIGPVWEANHVWLIFVLVVCWTAYPTAFGSIASTLEVPLFIASIGIILRGTAYVLRDDSASSPERRGVGLVFSLSSILTPFALGAAIGGIASGRVPIGNARGDLITSWLNPTSLLIGSISVTTSAYLAAVYLAADAVRLREPHVAAAFRLRALSSGVVAGALAFAGLLVVRNDAERLWHGLTRGGGLAAVVISAASGTGTLWLVWSRRYEPARATAAVAVAAVVAGWALAQRPQFLPGLTIHQAAAGRPTLVALLIGIAAGILILFPSLGLLYALVLRGSLDDAGENTARTPGRPTAQQGSRSLAPLTILALLVGLPLAVLADAGWARGLGIISLLGFVALGVRLIVGVGDQHPRSETQ
jgi:cytochrome bd ubiquinol oxidase subunit II